MTSQLFSSVGCERLQWSRIAVTALGISAKYATSSPVIIEMGDHFVSRVYRLVL